MSTRLPSLALCACLAAAGCTAHTPAAPADLGRAPRWSPSGAFPIGYWSGPPPSFNTLDQWQTIAAAGFNLAGPTVGYLDSKDTKKMLDYCQQVGLKALVSDPRAGDLTQVGNVIADYQSYPAVFGYHLVDEPKEASFQSLGLLSSAFQRADAARLPYVNLLPSYAAPARYGTLTYAEYLQSFLIEADPPLLSVDHYPFRVNGVDTLDYYSDLELIRQMALRYQVPAWSVLQAVGNNGRRVPSDAELRVQLYSSLAYGMKGLIWFLYWPYPESGNVTALVDGQGHPNSQYDRVARLNIVAKNLGEVMKTLASVGIYHTAPLPSGTALIPDGFPIGLPADQPLLVGLFQSPQGEHYALVVNRDYLMPHTFDATLQAGTFEVSSYDSQTGAAQSIAGAMVRLTLDAGEGKLFRFKPMP